MALVRKVRNAGLTFDQFADDVLKCAISKIYGTSMVDVVFDVYRENFIKDAEREERSTGALEFAAIVGNQPIKQWGSLFQMEEISPH